MAERVIGAFTFPSRKAAEREIRRILHDSPLNTPLPGHEHDLIAALVTYHHQAEEKIGPGIKHIEVRQIEYGSRGFWIVRVDGTSIDFSYRTALGGAPNQRQQVREALRVEVKDEIIQFRRSWFDERADLYGNITCPLTGLDVPYGKTAHVDHITPFSELADRFIAMHGGYDRFICVPSPEGVGLPTLKDRDLATKWRQFHADHAELRVVHASANLARYVRSGAA